MPACDHCHLTSWLHFRDPTEATPTLSLGRLQVGNHAIIMLDLGREKTHEVSYMGVQLITPIYRWSIQTGN